MNMNFLQNEFRNTIPFTLKKDARVLVIGCGGTGCFWLTKTKEMFIDRYGTTAVNESMDFLGIDTDKKQPEFNILTENEYFHLINLNRTDDSIREWLNPNIEKLDGLDDPNGAGDRPMVGRWKLFSSETEIINKLGIIISKYNTKFRDDGIKKVYVVVLSSIFGGTGCGIFIDIPYFVRKCIDENASSNSKYFDFYGILELPDSKIEKLGHDRAKRSRANAYAALNELCYYMNKETANYRAKFSNKSDFFECKKQVYNFCFLVSNYSVSCKNRNSYKKVPLKGLDIDVSYLEMAVPEVINAIISDPKLPIDLDGKTMKGFHGFDSGINNLRMDGFNLDKNNNSYPYGNTIGVSKIEIPLLQYILAIFSRLFQTLDEMWRNISDINEIMVLVTNKLAMSFNIIAEYDKIIEDTTMLTKNFDNDEVLKNDFDINHRGIIPLDPIKLKSSILHCIKDSINEIYASHGPFVALKVLENKDYLEFSFIFQLEQIKKKAQIRPSSVKDKKEKEIEEYNDIVNNTNKKIKEKELNSAKSALVVLKKDNALANAKEYVYKVILDCVTNKENGVLHEIREEHDRLFKNVTTMLTVLNNVFKTVNINTSSEETISNDENYHAYKWNSYNVPYSVIDNKIKLLFWKKIIINNDNENPKWTQSEIFKLNNDTNKNEGRIYFHTKDNGKIKIKFEGNQYDDVTEIKDVVRFVPGFDEEIPIQNMIYDFLKKIKDLDVARSKDNDWQNILSNSTIEKNNDAIFQQVSSIIVESLNDIINKFKTSAFENFIIYGHKDAVFGKTYEQKEKDNFFVDAIKLFNLRAAPSFPAVDADRAKTLVRENIALFFIPEIEKHYIELFNDNPPPLIKASNIEVLSLAKSSLMIAVNFYGGFNIASYYHLIDCKNDYDDLIKNEANIDGSTDAIGIYIAEGAKFNLRKILENDLIIPNKR